MLVVSVFSQERRVFMQLWNISPVRNVSRKPCAYTCTCITLSFTYFNLFSISPSVTFHIRMFGLSYEYMCVYNTFCELRGLHFLIWPLNLCPSKFMSIRYLLFLVSWIWLYYILSSYFLKWEDFRLSYLLSFFHMKCIILFDMFHF